MQNHPAKDHRGPIRLGNDDSDLQSTVHSAIEPPCISNHHLFSNSHPDTLPPPVQTPPGHDDITASINTTCVDPHSSAPTPNPTAPQCIDTSDAQKHSYHNLTSSPVQVAQPIRLFLDLFAGHSAPLSCAAKEANIDHFYAFDVEFDPYGDILNDDLFETILKLAHSGLVGAIWSAPPCRLYSSLRKNDGGPPSLRSKDFLDGLPTLTP